MNSKTKEDEMTVAAIEGSEQAKMDAYVRRLPKRDRRAKANANAQTIWIQEAVSEWYGFYVERLSSLGLPSENTLHRAGLMLPRAPLGSTTPQMPEPPARAEAVEKALQKMLPSRKRVLVACEKYADFGIERAASHLRMSVDSTDRYLRQARQSLADMLRVMEWNVPHEEIFVRADN